MILIVPILHALPVPSVEIRHASDAARRRHPLSHERALAVGAWLLDWEYAGLQKILPTLFIIRVI